MSDLFRTHYLVKDGRHYAVDVYGYDKEKEQIIYCVDNGKERKAKLHYVCGFGGNPYPGTLIEYYNIVLPNGKQTRLGIYA